MVDINDEPITSYSGAFSGCGSLTSIPKGLFDNNPQITDFNYCFSLCYSLASIPEGLFDNHPLVTNFSNCFTHTNITLIPDLRKLLSAPPFKWVKNVLAN